MELVEHHAVVPGLGGDSLLVVDGRLPCVSGEVWRLPEVLDLLEPVVGRPTYLRLATQATCAPERILRLHVFDAAGGDGERVALDRADPARLAPPELRPALERWLAEQRGAPVPAARAAWARPGWLAEAEAWAGTELRPVPQWPLSPECLSSSSASSGSTRSHCPRRSGTATCTPATSRSTRTGASSSTTGRTPASAIRCSTSRISCTRSRTARRARCSPGRGRRGGE